MSNINLGIIKKIVYDGNKEVSMPSGGGGEEQWEFVSDFHVDSLRSIIFEPNTFYKIKMENLDVIDWGGGFKMYFVDPTDGFSVQIDLQTYWPAKEFVFSTHSFSEVELMNVDFMGSYDSPTGIELYKRVS